MSEGEGQRPRRDELPGSEAPRREELPGSEAPRREELPGSEAPSSGWLPPSDASPATDPTDRPWERPATGRAEPAAWPGADAGPATRERGAPPAWPGSPDRAAPAPLPGGLRLASYGSRVQAAVVDFFVRLALVLAGTLVGAPLLLVGDVVGTVGLIAGLVVGFVLSLAYAPIMMARTGGQTVGHKASGTRIVQRDGSRLSGGRATVREVAVKWLLIDVIGGSFVVPTLLNYLWPLWDANNEALHDKLCSTRVVEA